MKEVMVSMFQPENDNKAQLQITSTYMHFWMFSYQIQPLGLLGLRFLFILAIFIFLASDVLSNREDTYEGKNVDYAPWLCKLLNWHYLWIFVSYINLLRLYVNHPIKWLYDKNKLEYAPAKDFEHFIKPDSPYANMFYWTAIAMSVGPALSSTILIMHGITENFGYGFEEWHFMALMITVFVVAILDNILFSNYYVNVSHIAIGFAFIHLFFFSCLFYSFMGLNVYPAFNYVSNTRVAIVNTIIMLCVYYVSFAFFVGTAMIKQTLGSKFLKTALWFRYEEKIPEIQGLKVTTEFMEPV